MQFEINTAHSASHSCFFPPSFCLFPSYSHLNLGSSSPPLSSLLSPSVLLFLSPALPSFVHLLLSSLSDRLPFRLNAPESERSLSFCSRPPLDLMNSAAASWARGGRGEILIHKVGATTLILPIDPLISPN